MAFATEFPPTSLVYRSRTEALEHLARILRELARPRVAFVDADEVTCRRDDRCDPKVEAERLREEDNHFSDEMAHFAGPQLLDIVLGEAVP